MLREIDGGSRCGTEYQPRVLREISAAAAYQMLLAKRPDVQLDKLENDSPDGQVVPVLTRAHVYQIGASRQIIAPHFQVNAALLARTPNLIAASSNGAGYDTIDVDACTTAGVVVVNQSGGNKEAVAEHALAMMPTLSKRIVEADRQARTGQAVDPAPISAAN
jgi:D-3-phosphoglycerate dehydrogenase / 2-oxoglutarate reductase